MVGKICHLIVLLIGIVSLSGCVLLTDVPRLIPSDPELEDLAFLTGAWVTEADETGMRREEIWTTPDGGTMLGVSRVIAVAKKAEERRTVGSEYLRIERSETGEVRLLRAGVVGESGRWFALIERTPTRFVFTNPEGAYPETITYEQLYEGRLLIRLEGEEEGQVKSEERVLRRARLMSGLTEAERRDREMRQLWREEQIYEDSMIYRPHWSHYE